MYLITGAKNVQDVLRSAGHLGNRELVLRVLPQLDSVTPKDLQRFKDDESGRGQKPLYPIAEKDRMWAPNHKIMVENLSSTAACAVMMEKFSELLKEQLDKRSTTQWEIKNLWNFVKTDIVEVAIISLAGTKLLELNPDFTEAMWGFDESVFPLVMGLPRFLYRKGFARRDRFHDMGVKWHEYAFANYDFDGPDVPWEEIWGTRFVREHAKFLKDRGFDKRSRSGMSLGSIWA